MSLEDRFEKIHQGVSSPTERMWYAETSVHSDSEVYDYIRHLGISLEELKGLSVLDIGGTIGGTFARSAKEANMDLVTFNPVLGEQTVDRHPKTVRGIVQEMPFENGSFDVELVLGSVPVYLPNYESDHRDAFGEMLRVLKVGGRAIIFPITEKLYKSEAFQRVIKGVEETADVHFEDRGLYDTSTERGIEKIRFYRLTLTKKKEV